MDKSSGRIRRLFDEISPTYDFLNHLFSLNIDSVWRRAAAEAAGRGFVLDVCSGTGDLAFALLDRGARVIGADFAIRMLLLAGRKRPLARTAADTLRLPFRDATFDAATVAFGLRNTESAPRALTEMARVVRPGGRVVVLEFVRSPLWMRFYLECLLPLLGDLISRSRAYTYLPRSVGSWYAPSALTSLMERTGLRDVTCTRVFPGLAAIHAGQVPPIAPLSGASGGKL